MPPPRGAVARDSALAVAREAIAEGRPWRATRVLAPMLRDSALRTPEVELVAATAAAGWHGWRETEQLLRNATWLDSSFGGEGRELLARAALGLGRDSSAVIQVARCRSPGCEPGDARRAPGAAGPGARGHRQLRQRQRRVSRGGRPASPRAGLADPSCGGHGDRLWRTARRSPDRSPTRWYGSRLPLAYALAFARAGDTTAAIEAYTAAGSAAGRLPAPRGTGRQRAAPRAR